jgi:osmotically inducible protein OsmC
MCRNHAIIDNHRNALGCIHQLAFPATLANAISSEHQPTSFQGGTTMPTRTSVARWEGTFKEGRGHLRGQSGLDMRYAFVSRFEDGPGTNPEELLAAAHAGCYSMALNAALERNGFVPEFVETEGACTLEKVGDGMSITKLKLTTRASVPGLSPEKFAEFAESTKTGCIVSRALSAVPMELDARLV